jgi:hypothetical protein
MASSYDKITEHVFKTDEWAELVRKAKRALTEPKVETGVEFYYTEDYDRGKHIGRGAVKYWAKLVDAPEDMRSRMETTLPSSHELYGSTIFSTMFVRSVFDATFGQPFPGRKKLKVPTYNCKQEKAWDSFKGDAVSRLSMETEAERKALMAVIRAEWLSVPQEDVAAGIERAYHAKAIADIKAQVLKWMDKVPTHVLKEALDEALVHAIMEA